MRHPSRLACKASWRAFKPPRGPRARSISRCGTSIAEAFDRATVIVEAQRADLDKGTEMLLTGETVAATSFWQPARLRQTSMQ
jgi:hypothetical protein